MSTGGNEWAQTLTKEAWDGAMRTAVAEALSDSTSRGHCPRRPRHLPFRCRFGLFPWKSERGEAQEESASFLEKKKKKKPQMTALSHRNTHQLSASRIVRAAFEKRLNSFFFFLRCNTDCGGRVPFLAQRLGDTVRGGPVTRHSDPPAPPGVPR